MRWTVHRDARSFLDVSRPVLACAPVLNQMPLGLAVAAANEPARYTGMRFCTVHADDGACLGAVVQSEGWKPVISAMGVAAAAFAGARFAEENPDVPGVFAVDAPAAAFAGAAFAPLRLRAVDIDGHMGAFELRSVLPVPAAEGARRIATVDDGPILQAFAEAFHDEALPLDPPVPPTAGHRYATSGKAHLWEAAGEVVAWANFSRDVEGFLSVGPVYTPPAHRGHGYATSLVAEMSAAALAEGRPGCTLFTDLANPTSNAIYQRIGYVRVGTLVRYAFRR